jgi:peptide-methionine (S)-S-oxide reductase
MKMDNSSHKYKMNRLRTAQTNDIVDIRFNLTPEHGYVPNTLFDTSGTLSLVLGWGNYLPGLHELITGMVVGESIQNQSIDAGWGSKRKDLIVTVKKNTMTSLNNPGLIQVGSKLRLKPTLEVEVVAVDDDTITVDANPPLAGSSFLCSLEVLRICSNPTLTKDGLSSSQTKIAEFALGCFWGAELAFLRVHGVVGTKVGYTQGITHEHPTYEDVCSGHTKHREAVMVIYDATVVSYEQLLAVAMERLKLTTVQYPNSLFHEESESEQYKHEFYYHDEEQQQQAAALLENDNPFCIELKPASTWFDAEEYHQKYLLKGGQSAKKGSKETIRCFG